MRSILLSLGATIGCLVIGYPVAYTLSRQTGRTQTLLLIGVMIPFWTSFVVRTYAWVNLLPNGGPVEHVLHTAAPVARLAQRCSTRRRPSRSASSTRTCR